MDSEEARKQREEAAARYKPETIRLLLVAEAPPKERYFYFEDVRVKDDLYLYVAKALLGEKSREVSRQNKAEQLAKLRAKEVFLIDLKPDPLMVRLRAQRESTY
jgi:hypothetical protein